ncbi:MAG: VWA domain-containing protein [Gemmatimonadota bacterium]|nr:VWA domain-containing protein [Gemmatimonadota bacterium]
MSALLLAVLLALGAVALRLAATRRSATEREALAEEGLLRRYVRLPASAVGIARLALLGLGVWALALASRSGGAESRRTDPEGVETIFLLDASNSMLAEDLEPDRLTVERELAARLATRVTGRIGVVYFAGRAYVLSPLTTDVNAVQMFVDGVRPAAVGLGGSSLAAGLTQAIDLLAGGDDEARKAIVLFSDGEETAGQPVQDAIDRAREAGIRVHAVGLGTAQGGQIPLTRDASLDPNTALRRRRGTAYLQGPDGETVITRLEEGVLQEIAAATGGRYVNGASGVDAIEREISVGDAGPLPNTGDAAVGFLLVLAFASLWGEGFLLPRG